MKINPHTTNVELCDELNDHPQMKGLRPHPVGIADCAVYRYEGTNVYQWWKQIPSAYWMPHGEQVTLAAT